MKCHQDGCLNTNCDRQANVEGSHQASLLHKDYMHVTKENKSRNGLPQEGADQPGL